MNKKILLSVGILVLLSVGSSLLADPVMNYGYDNLTLLGVSTAGPPESAALADLGYSHLTLINKWDGHTSPGSWTVTPSTGEFTEGIFVWNGSGVITHIVVKTSTWYALFLLENPLNSGDSQAITTDPTIEDPYGVPYFPELPLNKNDKAQAISHITGYGTTTVPEPATLVLLGIGLVAVPLTKNSPAKSKEYNRFIY